MLRPQKNNWRRRTYTIILKNILKLISLIINLLGWNKFLKIENKNITFFDDSKATNYHAVNEATKLFSADQEEGILILHGTHQGDS